MVKMNPVNIQFVVDRKHLMAITGIEIDDEGIVSVCADGTQVLSAHIMDEEYRRATNVKLILRLYYPGLENELIEGGILDLKNYFTQSILMNNGQIDPLLKEIERAAKEAEENLIFKVLTQEKNEMLVYYRYGFVNNTIKITKNGATILSKGMTNA